MHVAELLRQQVRGVVRLPYIPPIRALTQRLAGERAHTESSVAEMKA